MPKPRSPSPKDKEARKKKAESAKGINLSLIAVLAERAQLTPSETADWVRTVDHVRSLEAQTSVHEVLAGLAKRR